MVILFLASLDMDDIRVVHDMRGYSMFGVKGYLACGQSIDVSPAMIMFRSRS